MGTRSQILNTVRPTEKKVFPETRSIQYVNWARTALDIILDVEDLVNSTILLPAFICQDSFAPLFRRHNVTPEFVDVDPRTYHLNTETAVEHLDSVDAVLYVHAFGLPADITEFAATCKAADVLLIEDCARAAGAMIDGRLVGSFGDYAVYSLAKVAPIPKGGALLTPPEFPEPRIQPPAYDVHSVYSVLPSFITDAISATYPHDIERRKLDLLTMWAFRRYMNGPFEADRQTAHRHATRLRQALDSDKFVFQLDRAGRTYPTVPVLVPCNRDQLAHYLSAKNIPFRIVWGHPWGKTAAGRKFEATFPNTCRLTDSLLHLDIHAMDETDIEQTIDTILEFVEMFGEVDEP